MQTACNYDADADFNDGSCDSLLVWDVRTLTRATMTHHPPRTMGLVFCQVRTRCEGNCLNDGDGGGVCDEFEVDGYTDSTACNYSASATDDDGSCDFCTCASQGGLSVSASIAGYGIDVETVTEHTEGELAGMTTYRVYLTTAMATDELTAIVGDNEFPLSLATTTSFYQEAIFGGATPSNISAPALGLLPLLAFDSWVTIGIDGPASAAAGESNASIVAAAGPSF